METTAMSHETRPPGSQSLDVRRLSPDDDLAAVVEHINAAHWDEANDVQLHEAKALRGFLEIPDTVFLVCYLFEDGAERFAGMASGRIEHKPYDQRRWLYVDEVDCCSDLRRRGVGTALMKELLAIARRRGCQEVWLGTEADNVAANRLYGSLDPDINESVQGYTFTLNT